MSRKSKGSNSSNRYSVHGDSSSKENIESVRELIKTTRSTSSLGRLTSLNYLKNYKKTIKGELTIERIKKAIKLIKKNIPNFQAISDKMSLNGTSNSFSIECGTAVIVDFGSRTIKVGTPDFYSQCRQINYDEEALELNEELFVDYVNFETYLNEYVIEKAYENKLIKVLKYIFYQQLVIESAKRHVIIIEKELMPLKFKRILTKILFDEFEVGALQFLPSSVCSVLTSYSTTGIVVDCGYLESSSTPVVEGTPLMKHVQTTGIGSKYIINKMRELMTKYAKVLRPVGWQVTDCLSLKSLESIVSRTAIANPDKKHNTNEPKTEASTAQDITVSVTTQNNNQPIEILIPGFVREMLSDFLFEDSLEEDVSIQTIILQSLLKIPVDHRRQCASNIVLCGGLSKLKGFKQKLEKEIHTELNKTAKYKEILGTIKWIKFSDADVMFDACSIPFVGALIANNLECIPTSLTVFDAKQKIPDWSLNY